MPGGADRGPAVRVPPPALVAGAVALAWALRRSLPLPVLPPLPELGAAVVLAGLGLALRWGDLWGWLAVLASQQMLARLAIAREEPYLAARFGPPYEAYRARVRRWL